MRLPEVFFEERRRHLLSWDGRPVLGAVHEAEPSTSAVRRTSPARAEPTW